MRVHANRCDSCLREGKQPPNLLQDASGAELKLPGRCGREMPCYSLVSLGKSIPNAQTFAKKKHKVQPGVQVCSADAHRAHALAAALLNGMLNHPVWALSVNWRFPAGAGAQSAGRCCFPGEELAVPRARECWCSWMGPQRFQHNVSPGLQPPELAPLAAYCVLVGGFSTSVNLFLSFTTTPRHCCRTWTDIAFSQQGLALGQVG